MSTKLDIDGFLSHASGSGGGSILSWKDDGKTLFWLHPKSHIFALWRHSWYEVVETEDESGDKVKRVFSRRWCCHERELILRKQHFRDRATDEREYPPEICPMDLMIEAVRKLVREKAISWVDPVFHFEGDDPRDKYNITLLAGGLHNAFNMKDPSSTQKAEMRRAGVRRDEAYRQNVQASLQYMFVGVANTGEDGIQIAIESKTIGDKMKGAIRDRLRAKERNGGRDKGDPWKNPYPFEWTFDEAANFDAKYHVVALEDEPSPEILRLFKDEMPDVSQITKLGDCRWLYDSMKAHCVLKDGLPWDDIFGPARKAGLLAEPKADDGDDIPDIGPDETESDAVPGYECDACGDPNMQVDDVRCGKCGAEYGEDAQLKARPCSTCNTIVQIDKTGERSICGKCATIYNNKDWSVFRAGPEPKEQPERPKRTRSEAAAAKAGGSVPWVKD